MYVFILIALRTLRFEPVMVILTGVTASIGWGVLLIYAVAHQQACTSMEIIKAITGDDACNITHMFSTYMTSYEILVGAELDKMVSIFMVTMILAIALVRARKLLIRAATEHQAAADLSRFFAPEVAGRIRDTDVEIAPGDAELRQAAIIMTDLRGFTPLTEQSATAKGDGAVVRLSKPGGGGDLGGGRQYRQVHGRRHPRKLWCSLA